MSSQAESLQQLMSFFNVGDGFGGALASRPNGHAAHLPQPPAPQVVLAHPRALEGAQVKGANGSDHGFKRF
jgi:hypothetical protein